MAERVTLRKNAMLTHDTYEGCRWIYATALNLHPRPPAVNPYSAPWVLLFAFPWLLGKICILGIPFHAEARLKRVLIGIEVRIQKIMSYCRHNLLWANVFVGGFMVIGLL